MEAVLLGDAMIYISTRRLINIEARRGEHSGEHSALRRHILMTCMNSLPLVFAKCF